MSFWNRLLRRQASPVLSPPDGMQESDITLESSICTGETVIGFRSKTNGRLLNAVAVRTRADINSQIYSPKKSAVKLICVQVHIARITLNGIIL